MRREFLKAYVFTLLAEGALNLHDLRGGVTKVLSFAADDAKALLEDLARMAVEYGAVRVQGLVQSKYNDYATVYRQGGFRGLWQRVTDDYQRGVDAMGGTRK